MGDGFTKIIVLDSSSFTDAGSFRSEGVSASQFGDYGRSELSSAQSLLGRKDYEGAERAADRQKK